MRCTLKLKLQQEELINNLLKKSRMFLRLF